MPRVSDIDDACGISAHHMFLSNCVVQVMRVWLLAAVLSPLAKLHRRYGVTAAFGRSTATKAAAPLRESRRA